MRPFLPRPAEHHPGIQFFAGSSLLLCANTTPRPLCQIIFGLFAVAEGLLWQFSGLCSRKWQATGVARSCAQMKHTEADLPI
jgi:hypothetical protein